MHFLSLTGKYKSCICRRGRRHNYAKNKILHLFQCFFKMSLRMRKPTSCICENKGADQLCSNAQLISAFVIVTRIVQFIFCLYQKFQASNFIKCLYSLVCVRPGQKPKLLGFSRTCSNVCTYYCFGNRIQFIERGLLELSPRPPWPSG